MGKPIQVPFNGVTTGSYGDNTLSMNVSRKDTISVSVKNTDSTNGIKFKIEGYYDKKGDVVKHIKTEDTLAGGDIYNKMIYDEAFDHIDVLIKEAVAGDRATWLVHYNLK